MVLIQQDDPQGYKGTVRVSVFDGDISLDALTDSGHADWSRLVSSFEEHNLVTNQGRQQMTRLIVAETTSVATHIAFSTDAITPAFTDTVATIVTRIGTQALTLAQSFNTFYQRYVTYVGTATWGTTGINTLALLDAASTVATTNLWADASVTVAKSTTQALIAEWRIQATTG